MKARLIQHDKVYGRDGNIIEVKVWEVETTSDKLHGHKYSLVYIVKGKRVIGYDNAEGKGDHNTMETGKSLTGLRASKN